MIAAKVSPMWKKIRITLLLFILLSLALSNWRGQSRARNWDASLQVAIFPINGDNSSAAAQTIATLRTEDFQDIEHFLNEQAKHYGVASTRPVRVSLQAPLTTAPPAAPRQPSALDAIVWSLKLRYWAWRQPAGVPRATIRAFVIYWDSDAHGGRVPNSHGLAKGQIAISHVHAAQAMWGSNNVVSAHEILHTMGATDKYGPDLSPIFPEGFANPEANPRYPQQRCEIMAGRIPLSAQELEMPRSLAHCLIGPQTAHEIGITR